MKTGRCVDTGALAEYAALGERADDAPESLWNGIEANLATANQPASGARWDVRLVAVVLAVGVLTLTGAAVFAVPAAPADRPLQFRKSEIIDAAIDGMKCSQMKCPRHFIYTLTAAAQHSVFGRRRRSAAESVGLLKAVVAVSGETPFIVDGNRVYAELGFVRPDGSVHRALAFVDMGSQFMEVRKALYDELHLKPGRALSIRIGQLPIDVAGADVRREDRPPSSVGSDLEVEAALPASVLQRYRVTIDYQSRTLTVAPAGGVTPDGTPVPVRVDAKTGLAVIDLSIDGRRYHATIDSGSAYTWVRQSTGAEWLRTHPDWNRGVGAVGPSNMMMAGDTSETAGTMLRLPAVGIGPIVLTDVGALAAGPSRLIRGYADLFDWYSEKNPERVAGWIGGNVLKAFRLTIDYPSRTSFWLKQGDIDAHDLDQIGLTLKRDGPRFVVAAVATKNGRPAVDDVDVGDALLRVGDRDVTGATPGAVYAALHGTPGEVRTITVERNGIARQVSAKVTAF